jgi:hypothetical protein
MFAEKVLLLEAVMTSDNFQLSFFTKEQLQTRLPRPEQLIHACTYDCNKYDSSISNSSFSQDHSLMI